MDHSGFKTVNNKTLDCLQGGKNFDLYNYYKKKINFEIEKSKSAYYAKLISSKNKTVWNAVKEEKQKSSSHFSYGSDVDLANIINNNLRKIMTDNSKTYKLILDPSNFKHIYFSQEEVAD